MATRQLAAIMFTDMVGYTALMQENEKLAIEKRNRNKTIFESSLSKYDGTLLQHYGDGTLSINTSAVNAILSAIEMQTLNRKEKIDLRIGIHIGEILKDDSGIYGDSVNVASRIESLAVPGSIFISEKLYDDVKNHESIQTRPLGYFELKNVRQPVQVFSITNEGIISPSRDEVRGKVKDVSNSIAVLPFVSLSSDPENEYFCDGMTEELLNVLSKIEGLQVTSRTSSFGFKGTKEDIREIAAKLNVRQVLEGSVRKSGNKVRITAQLINASDGYHYWSETYDRSIEDIFEVQDDISRTIANKLRTNLSKEEHESRLVTGTIDNLDAYNKYLEGIHYWNQQSIHAYFKALTCFEEAAYMEPEFTKPYSYIAILTSSFAFIGLISAKEAEQKCRRAVELALRHDPSNPSSILAEGICKVIFDWNWNAGFNAIQRCLAINPNFAMAYQMLSWYYLLLLDYEKSIETIEKALRCDPMGGDTNAYVAQIHLMARNYDKAIAAADYALSLESQNFYALHMKALALGFSGHWDKAIMIINKSLELIPDFPVVMVSQGIAYVNLGQPEKTENIIERLKEIQLQKPGLSLSAEIAMLYMHLNQMDKFYEYYDQSLQEKSFAILSRYGSPYMKNVRNDEHLIKSRIQIGLPY